MAGKIVDLADRVKACLFLFDDAVFVQPSPLAFKLRLDEGEHLSALRKELCRRGKNVRQGDKAHVDDDAVRRFGKIASLEIAHICPVHDDDARIGCKLGRELTLAHINGIDSRRTRLQQAIGKTARAGAEIRIDADDALRKIVERLSEFISAFGDKLHLSGPDADVVPFFHIVGSLRLFPVHKDIALCERACRLGARRKIALGEIFIQPHHDSLERTYAVSSCKNSLS